MNSKASGADFTIAFPDSVVGIMDARIAAKILCDGAEDEIKETAARFDALQNNIECAAERGYVDEIVEVLYTKREEFPAKKHSTK